MLSIIVRCGRVTARAVVTTASAGAHVDWDSIRTIPVHPNRMHDSLRCPIKRNLSLMSRRNRKLVDLESQLPTSGIWGGRVFLLSLLRVPALVVVKNIPLQRKEHSFATSFTVIDRKKKGNVVVTQ